MSKNAMNRCGIALPLMLAASVSLLMVSTGAQAQQAITPLDVSAPAEQDADVRETGAANSNDLGPVIDALVGRRATLQLSDGRELTGSVLLLEEGQLVVAVEPSETLATVAASDVVSARLLRSLDGGSELVLTERRSMPMFAAGIVTTVAGAFAFSTWLWIDRYDNHNFVDTIPQGIGASLVVTGIPMMVVGGQRLPITPTVHASSGNGDRRVQAGVALRF